MYVQALMGDSEKWDSWNEIRRVNPLMARFENSRKRLLAERDAAKRDTRLQARFLSYRLNNPTQDAESVLLTVPDWQAVLSREVGAREGRPLVGVDLGGGRSWSAAVGIWPSGRVEAVALAPGIPSIEEQENRDRVPSGSYRRLVEDGTLRIAEGLRVQPVGELVDMIRSWQPAAIVCDRFRFRELQDCNPCPIIPRVTRWSESGEDIRAFRKLALDGGLSVEALSQRLLSFSMAEARVSGDTSGNVRMTKKDPSKDTGRDDAAAGLVLASGAFERASKKPGKLNYAVAR